MQTFKQNGKKIFSFFLSIPHFLDSFLNILGWQSQQSAPICKLTIYLVLRLRANHYIISTHLLFICDIVYSTSNPHYSDFSSLNVQDIFVKMWPMKKKLWRQFGRLVQMYVSILWSGQTGAH